MESRGWSPADEIGRVDRRVVRVLADRTRTIRSRLLLRRAFALRGSQIAAGPLDAMRGLAEIAVLAQLASATVDRLRHRARTPSPPAPWSGPGVAMAQPTAGDGRQRDTVPTASACGDDGPPPCIHRQIPHRSSSALAGAGLHSQPASARLAPRLQRPSDRCRIRAELALLKPKGLILVGRRLLMRLLAPPCCGERRRDQVPYRRGLGGARRGRLTINGRWGAFWLPRRWEHREARWWRSWERGKSRPMSATTRTSSGWSPSRWRLGPCRRCAMSTSPSAGTRSSG